MPVMNCLENNRKSIIVGATASVSPENKRCHWFTYSPKKIETARVIVAFDLSVMKMSGKKKSFHTLTKLTIETIDRAGLTRGRIILQ